MAVTSINFSDPVYQQMLKEFEAQTAAAQNADLARLGTYYDRLANDLQESAAAHGVIGTPSIERQARLRERQGQEASNITSKYGLWGAAQKNNLMNNWMNWALQNQRSQDAQNYAAQGASNTTADYLRDVFSGSNKAFNESRSDRIGVSGQAFDADPYGYLFGNRSSAAASSVNPPGWAGTGSAFKWREEEPLSAI